MASVLRATISIKKCISANCKKVSLTPNFPRCKITTNSPIFQYLLLGIFQLKKTTSQQVNGSTSSFIPP